MKFIWFSTNHAQPYTKADVYGRPQVCVVLSQSNYNWVVNWQVWLVDMLFGQQVFFLQGLF